MKTVFAVYITDAWHSHASKDLLGITTTRKKAYQLLKNKGYKLTIDDIEDMEKTNQTQGKEINFMIDPFWLNEGLERV